MEAEKATPDHVDGFEIARMSRLLEVSRSGYYDWARREAAGPSPAQQRRADLTSKIVVSHTESDRVYGSPRILADLRAAGEQVSAKTVAKLMRTAGIAGISPRGFVPVTTQAGPDPYPVPDLVRRRFDQGQLNRVWSSDITYLSTGEGWLYLCAVRDGCSRRVVGWAVEDHLHTDLVESEPNEISRASMGGSAAAAAGGSALTEPDPPLGGLLTDRAPVGSPVTGLLMGCRARL